MPHYDYAHTEESPDCKLGQVFERFEAIVQQPLIYCPECNKQVHRIISGGAGIIFRGSGWYQTDYKNTKPDKPTPDTKPSEHKSADPAKATEPKTYKKD